MYLVGYNGGEIIDCGSGETIYRIALSYGQIIHVMQTAHQMGLHIHTYTDTNIISPTDDDELHFYQRHIKTPVIYSEDMKEVKEDGACKCIVIELKDSEKLEAFRKSLLPWAEKEGITMLYSNPYYLEVFPAASGKGAAVKKLCEILGINPALAVAAGDAGNDISMIEEAGMGIAMINGSEDIKMAATTITAYDNDHDGLAQALYDLI
jgi:hypothetical protein